ENRILSPMGRGPFVLTGPNVILTLKIAVATVTVLLIAAVVAAARGNYRLHGRINLVFFTLTLMAVLGLELVVRLIAPEVFDYINNDSALRQALNRHLWFSVPSTFVLPAMLYTGLKGYVRVHLSLAACFAVLWSGTFITGIFFLPPTPW
ncbi:MAG: DUF420 domain-containing protein, partial [Gemmataceae bacterium]